MTKHRCLSNYFQVWDLQSNLGRNPAVSSVELHLFFKVAWSYRTMRLLIVAKSVLEKPLQMWWILKGILLHKSNAHSSGFWLFWTFELMAMSSPVCVKWIQVIQPLKVCPLTKFHGCNPLMTWSFKRFLKVMLSHDDDIISLC